MSSPTQEQPARAQHTPPCLLLVEDHEASRAAVSTLLSRNGYVVIGAGSGEDALSLASSYPFDLVISDIGLPGIDGCGLMKQLRERYGLHGIAVTAYKADADIERGREAGFEAYLTKPLNSAQLSDTVRAFFTEPLPSASAVS